MAIGEDIFVVSRQLSANSMGLMPPVGEGVSGEGEKAQPTGDVYVGPVVSHPRESGDPVRVRDPHFHGDDKEVFVPDQYNDPRHTFSAEERVKLYRGLQSAYSHLVTPFTKRLIRIADLMDFFTGLESTAFQYDQRQARDEIRSMFSELQRLTKEIVRMYTRKEVLPGFAISKMVTSAYKGKDAVAVLLDYDFTSVNHFDDTDSLGDELVLAIGDSLWDVLRSEEAIRYLGEEVVRVRYPQRSAFLVVGNNEKVDSFLKGKYPDIENKIYERLERAQREGRIASEVDLDSFRLSALSHSTAIKLSQFKDDLRTRKISEPAVVEYIFKELKRLSGETTFIKAHSKKSLDPAQRIAATMVDGGVSVYGQEVLPRTGETFWASLCEFVRNGRGFVPLGKFGPGLLEVVEEIRRGLTWSDYNHTVGAITRDTRFDGGGALEDVKKDIERFLRAPVQAGNGAFEIFKNKVRHLCLLLLNVGEETRRSDRAPHFMNADKVWKNGRVEINDFFVEQLGLLQADLSKKAGRDIKLNLLFVADVDDGKAHDFSFPVQDNVDASFQMNGWKVFTTYSDKGGYPIVGGALGDQMWFSASLEKKDGTSFIPEEILGAIQESAKAYFVERGEIYQVFAKIEMPDGTVERLPVWLMSGQAVASPGYLQNGVKVQKHETLTICYTEMPDISAPDAAAQTNRKRHLMLSYVGELKKRNGWRKEGLGRLPPDYVNGDTGKKGPNDLDIGAIRLYDPKARLDGGVVRDRGWAGSDSGAYLSGRAEGRANVSGEEALRRAREAGRALEAAKHELGRAKKK